MGTDTMKSYGVDGFLNPSDFSQVSSLCIEKTKEFTEVHYAAGYGRYGVFIEFPKEIEDIFIAKAKEHFKLDDLLITYVQLVKYQIINGNTPKLVPHIDKLPCTHIIDLCIDTTLKDWGLMVEDTLFIDKPNSAVFLYGNEETHSRPEYSSDNQEDYSLQLFINFAPADFWFFKGDYKKALKYGLPTPIMYTGDAKNITLIQK
jgi:hypothetical protein